MNNASPTGATERLIESLTRDLQPTPRHAALTNQVRNRP